MKCPKCGHYDPYWMNARNDRYAEFAHLDDVPEAKSWPLGIPFEKDGLVYWRTKKYVNRLPSEIFAVQGKTGGHGYWDAGNFDKAHKRKGDTMTEPLKVEGEMRI